MSEEVSSGLVEETGPSELPSLSGLVGAGVLGALDARLATFLSERESVDGWIAGVSAALVSRSLAEGDVCVSLAANAGRPLFPVAAVAASGSEPANIPVLIAPPLAEWKSRLATCRCVGSPGELKPLILDGDSLYLGRYFAFEQSVADALLLRVEAKVETSMATLAEGLERLFPIEADGPDWQRIAAASAVLRPFAVVSGGPGTGKTTTVVKILALLLGQDPGLRILLAAPTGKAADRLGSSIEAQRGKPEIPEDVREAIPAEASTLHRMLGLGRRASGRRKPVLSGSGHVRADVVVVDEASMVDLPMMARLLAALPESCRLILLGDRDQLASVEAGRVLGDICGHGSTLGFRPATVEMLEECGAVKKGLLISDESIPAVGDAVVSLRKSYRFSADSGIGRVAFRVRDGESGVSPAELFASDESLYWMPCPGDAPDRQVVAWAADRYRPMAEAGSPAEALAALQKIRVLCAVQKGEFGVERMNARIESALRRSGALEDSGGQPSSTFHQSGTASGEFAHYHGRPILIRRNDSETGLFNGDTGVIWRDEEGLGAWFPAPEEGEVYRVGLYRLPEHETAFATTVHKSQGSEFDAVLFVLPPEETRTAGRELVYTAVTRARSVLAVAGTEEAFRRATASAVERSTGLGRRLGWREERPG